MTDFTPTTEQVRQAYGVAHELTGASMDEREFDRWLAQHDREVAAEAWDAAVKAMRYEDGTPVELVSVVNPYRATRIEQGDES